MPSLANLTFFGKTSRECQADFSGGDLSSDSGMLLIGQFLDCFGITSFIRDNFGEERHPACKHTDADILLQLLCQPIAGYFPDDTADTLADDPVLKQVLGKGRLASQPTISRFNGRLGHSTLLDLESILKFTRKQAYRVSMPEEVILDIDSTHLPTYGKQEGGEFNAHYQATGYHPLLCYDGNTGDLLKQELREGGMYCGKGVADFLRPLLKEYATDYPKIGIMVRGDSGFAMPELYTLAEASENEATYVIRLKLNEVLRKLTQGVADGLLEECQGEGCQSAKPRYGETEYQARSWEKPRRVVYKIEMRQKDGSQELFPSYTFIVTNRKEKPEDIVRLYCQRGKMENFIKESKNEFNFKGMHSREMVTNENRLMIAGIAYNAFNLFRRLCLAPQWRKFRANEIRLRLIKIAGRCVSHAGRRIFRLRSNCPYQEQFRHAYGQALALERRLAG